jgi:hypothetical protein
MYSSALFEIIIFALIALVLVTKLIDMLGRIDEDDPMSKMKSKSFFGESTSSIKNVTEERDENQSSAHKLLDSLIKKAKSNSSDEYADLVLATDSAKLKVINTLKLLDVRIPNFNATRFVEGANKAFSMTAEAVKAKDTEVLQHLVDKRFLNDIQSNDYISLQNPGAEILKSGILDAYTFGNSVFIKMLFEIKCPNSDLVSEEWVFIKNLLDLRPIWQISSITTA